MRRSPVTSCPPAVAATTVLAMLALFAAPTQASVAPARHEPGVRAIAEVLAAVARDLLVVETKSQATTPPVAPRLLVVALPDQDAAYATPLAERLLDLPPPAG